MNPTGPVLPPVLSDPRQVRQAYLRHEANVKSIGTLYIFGAGLTLLVTIPMLSHTHRLDAMGEALVGIFMAYLLWWIGIGIRELKLRPRFWATVVSAIGLLGFPFGTGLNIFILYLLHSAKGKMVFSPEYKAVIDATPDIKVQTSKLLLAVSALFLLAIAALYFLGVYYKHK